VRGIAQLVASSVKGLKAENVTITDSTGQLLWPQGDGTGRRRRRDEQARRRDALRDRDAGEPQRPAGPDARPGKARVQVKADLDVDKTTLSKVQVDGKPVAAKDTPRDRAPAGRRRDRRRHRGHGRQHPDLLGQRRRAGANSNYNRRSQTVENIVPRTVTHTDVAPGGVNSLQVALVVDKSVSAADYAVHPEGGAGRRGYQPDARRRLPGLAGRLPQAGRRAEGRPGAGRRCSARSSGSASASPRSSSSSSCRAT
jgi:flagellar M-ring protein FliF